MDVRDRIYASDLSINKVGTLDEESINRGKWDTCSDRLALAT